MSIELNFTKPGADPDALASELRDLLGDALEVVSSSGASITIRLVDGIYDELAIANVIAAHDSNNTPKKQRQILEANLAGLVGQIDFAALDARILTMPTETAISGLSRAIYLVAIAVGMSPPSEQAAIAAQELIAYLTTPPETPAP